MIRTQISLTEEQMAGLRAAAERRGTSIAAVVRDAVEAELAGDDWEMRKRRALAAVGGYRSGRDDISEKHDDELARDLLS